MKTESIVGYLLTLFVICVMVIGFQVMSDLNDGRVRDMIIN